MLVKINPYQSNVMHNWTLTRVSNSIEYCTSMKIHSYLGLDHVNVNTIYTHNQPMLSKILGHSEINKTPKIDLNATTTSGISSTYISQREWKR